MIGAKVKELRKAKGLYQRQLAVALDTDTAFICKIENEEKRISTEYLLKLSKVLDVDHAVLLSYWLADKLTDAKLDEGTALRTVNELNGVLDKLYNK
jgi:transcriptional regulator with XRE-family HTH domain